LSINDRAVAQAYQDFLSVALDESAVVAVATWGLSDRHTWTKDKPRQDGSAVSLSIKNKIIKDNEY
jgi:endo-1,4-beta-xylanase